MQKNIRMESIHVYKNGIKVMNIEPPGDRNSIAKDFILFM